MKFNILTILIPVLFNQAVNAAVFSNEVSARSLALYADGKILVAGSSTDDVLQEQFALLRLDSEGKPDSSFGNHGKVFTDVSDGCEFIYALTLDSSQRPAAIGNTDMKGCQRSQQDSTQKTVVVRYLSSGILDSTFGQGGLAKPFPTMGKAAGIAALSNGELLVAMNTGATITPTTTVLRLKGDGTPQALFGGAGVLQIDHILSPEGYECKRGSIAKLQLGQDEKSFYAIGGRSCKKPTSGVYFTVHKFFLDGSPDTSFGDKGMAISYAAPWGRISAVDMKEQTGGELLVAGEREDGDIGGVESRWIIHRFEKTGKRVSVAPSQKEIGARLGNGLNSLAGIALLSGNGLCVAFGTAMDWGSQTANGKSYGKVDVGLQYFDTSGFGSTTLGARGRFRYDVIEGAESKGAYQQVSAGAMDNAGRMILSGSFIVSQLNWNSFFVMRLQKNGLLDPSFGKNGVVTEKMVFGVPRFYLETP